MGFLLLVPSLVFLTHDCYFVYHGYWGLLLPLPMIVLWFIDMGVYYGPEGLLLPGGVDFPEINGTLILLVVFIIYPWLIAMWAYTHEPGS